MNPFKVLNINRYASNREIILAVALGMREKKYSVKELAKAQKMLLDPVSRACQEFLHFIDLADAKAKLIREIIEKTEILDNPETSDPPQLKCLTIFEKNHGL